MLDELIPVLGICTVGQAIAHDPELRDLAVAHVPAPMLDPLIGATVAGLLRRAGLPRLVVLTHPDVLVAEFLLGDGHEVLVAIAPREAGGPEASSVVESHPREVRVIEHGDPLKEARSSTAAFLAVRVRTISGLALPVQAALACRAFQARLLRRHAVTIGDVERAPRGWVTLGEADFSNITCVEPVSQRG